jgi:signal transduction histidine kinase
MQLTNSQLQMVLVYFVYGLAFFSMGIALTLETGRSPVLVEKRALRFLAVFGLVHGTHEWMEIILLQGAWLGMPFPRAFLWLRVILLTCSFLPLVLFGIVSLSSRRRLEAPYIYIIAGLVIVDLLLIAVNMRIDPNHLVARTDALARYLLATPGGLLAGIALLARARQVENEDRQDLVKNFRWAAVGMGLYGITQVFVPAVDMIPARMLNAETFRAITGLPIQMVRASVAILVTVNLIRAIQATERERAKQLLAAQKARVEALEQVQEALIKREGLRLELLRHTVIAQEEERARIARELHDQTSQELTAFSLNLATLRNSLPQRSKAMNLVLRLQQLSQQMSQGLYRMVRDLRPAQLDDLGLVPTLKYLADEGRELFNLEIDVEIEGTRQRLDPLIETVIFRVAQEALSNVSRHAGTEQAKLKLAFNPEQVILRVEDEGAGFDIHESLSPPRGWGLAGMQERAESLGGELRIQSCPGSGTIVQAILPVALSSHDDQLARQISKPHAAEYGAMRLDEHLVEEMGHENYSSHAG